WRQTGAVVILRLRIGQGVAVMIVQPREADPNRGACAADAPADSWDRQGKPRSVGCRAVQMYATTVVHTDVDRAMKSPEWDTVAARKLGTCDNLACAERD